MNREELERLSKPELIDLLLGLQRPDKTSRTSSKPPSTDRKGKREGSRPGGAKPGHKGHARALAETADTHEDHRPAHCQHCGLPFVEDAMGEVIGEYDEIDLPAVKPIIRRHRRMSCTCLACGKATSAPVPQAAQGTPFGRRIHALALYLKSNQLFSYQRLQGVFGDLFGLDISQGALMNMFKRAAPIFAAKRDDALVALRRATVVACDETGMRIEGCNGYQWVFCAPDAVVHTAAFSRAAQVVRDTMAGHQPAVWIFTDRVARQPCPPTDIPDRNLVAIIPASDHTEQVHVDHSNAPRLKAWGEESMGQFSVKIYRPPGSILSATQQHRIQRPLLPGRNLV